MLAAVHSAAVLGTEAHDVTVQVDIAAGLPQFTVVGLAAGAARQSRERIVAALVNSGFALLPRRITISLHPAGPWEDGSVFDLPIAVGLLACTGQFPSGVLPDLVVVGNLGFDGSLRAVRGALPISRRVSQLAGRHLLVLPPANVAEASLANAVCIAAPRSLRDLAADFQRRSVSASPL